MFRTHITFWGRRGFKSYVNWVLESVLARLSSSATILTSQNERQAFARLAPGKPSAYIPNGASKLDADSLAVKRVISKKVRVVFVGRFEEQKDRYVFKVSNHNHRKIT